MASTLAELRTRVRDRADQTNSLFIGDDELTIYINQSAFELRDLIIQVYEDYYISTTQVTLGGGVNTTTLPSDFYKLRGIDYLNSAPNDWQTVRPFTFSERNARSRSTSRLFYGLKRLAYRIMGQNVIFLPEDDAAGTYRIWYVPRAVPMAADTDTLDNVLDFDEYVVVDAAIKCLVKEESDPSALMAEKSSLRQRILDLAHNRDAGEPQRVSDVSESQEYLEQFFPV